MTENTETTLTPEAAPAAEAPATWESLGLSEAALELIRKAGFRAPTPVQQQSIPIALDNYDLIASAQTGTGKTAAFVLPMVDRFAGREGTYGLILAPTREIAQQIQQTIEILGTPRGVRSIVLIGGIPMTVDDRAIATYPQIIVATPGRLCDHLDRGNIWLDFIQMVVLDEADRMLDMGFSDQLNRIMEDVPQDRQTLLFSATIPPNVESLARKIMYEPKRITIGKPLSAAKTVEQRALLMSEEDKNRELRRILREEPGSIIVFTRSKDKATRVWRSLHSAGVYDATYIHSDRLQSHRESALADFKSGKFRILVATDVAGRGIHVDGIAHVVNFDLPMEPEDYVHRIGRTGRAEATGRATSFVTGQDRRILAEIEKLIGKRVPTRFGGDPEPTAQAAGETGAGDAGGEQRLRSNGHDRGPRPEGAEGQGRGRRRRGKRGGGGAESGDPRPRSPQTQAQPQQPRQQTTAPIQAAAHLAAGDNFYQPAGGGDSASDETGADANETAPQGAAPGQPGSGGKGRRRRRGGRGRRGKGGSGSSSSGGGQDGGPSFPV